VISRFLLAAFLAVIVLVCGTTTFLYLGSKASKVAAAPIKPTSATPRAQALQLPGTLYLAQSGALYSLNAGRFHQLTAEGGWAMPSLSPDNNTIIAVKQTAMYSDVYVLNRFGSVIRRVTNNAAPPRSFLTNNHWAFYPRLSADGKTLWMAYDQPKFGYNVVLSIWAMPLAGSIKQGKLWTNAADYTGGDVQPVPVKGGMIYTKYDFASRHDNQLDSRLTGMLWYTNRAYSAGRELTAPAEDCRTPALSPDGRQIAMVCTYLKQVSYLVIASWNGTTLGPRKAIITNQMVAQPTWAPDGSGIAYLAPGEAAGPFQLWWLPRAAYAPAAPSPSPSADASPASPAASPTAAAPVKPIQVTTNNGFEATSPMAWG
jgi:WD40 repeat protein